MAPPALKLAWEAAARDRGVTLSALIREAMAAYLAAPSDPGELAALGRDVVALVERHRGEPS